MVELEMIVFFYRCEMRTELSSIDGYLFNEWDGFRIEASRPDWRNRGAYLRDLVVGLRVTIDGYRELDYIYKGLCVYVNDLIRIWGIHDVANGMPEWKLFFNPYVIYPDQKIPRDED